VNLIPIKELIINWPWLPTKRTNGPAAKRFVSVSGGKTQQPPCGGHVHGRTQTCRAAFADTGNEHDETYAYLDLPGASDRRKRSLESKAGLLPARSKLSAASLKTNCWRAPGIERAWF